MCAHPPGEWATGRELDLIEAVQVALVAAFRIPERERDVVLDIYPSNRCIVSTSRSDNYTRIEIIGVATRSMDAKRMLFRAISDNLAAAGVPSGQTRIMLIEPSQANWGVMGGIPASETDLGFKLQV